MKKTLISMLLVIIVASSLNVCFAAEKKQGPKGPAPNSGDGVPDGSGF